jgi:Zn-finger protein
MCGSVISEKEIILDESGNRVLQCSNCNAIISKRMVKMVAGRPLPAHLSKTPEIRIDKRPE